MSNSLANSILANLSQHKAKASPDINSPATAQRMPVEETADQIIWVPL